MYTQNSRYHLNRFQARPNPPADKVLPDMSETLGDLIRRRMRDLGIKNNSELARMIKRSDAYVGDLVNDRAKTRSGTYLPKPATVTNLSKALKVKESEILEAAGYAGASDVDRGFFRGAEHLTLEQRQVIQQTINAFIEKVAAEENPDTDYIDDDFEE